MMLHQLDRAVVRALVHGVRGSGAGSGPAPDPAPRRSADGSGDRAARSRRAVSGVGAPEPLARSGAPTVAGDGGGSIPALEPGAEGAPRWLPPLSSPPAPIDNAAPSAPAAPAAPADSATAELGHLGDEEVARLFAVAAWSAIAEPGDVVAGIVVSCLGADRALSMLIEKRSSAEWLAALPEGLHDGGLAESDLSAALDRWCPRLSSRAVLVALRSASRIGARLLCPGDAEWPAGFETLGQHQPIALWVRGDPAALRHPGGSIALVGSRDATSYGEHMAMDLAAGLSDRGFAIVSGAAYGIDGMVHRACLASRGRTVAYLAGGVDRLYPAAHHDLLMRTIATGAVVSEMPCGAAPTKWRFLQRNRLIAAGSHATVVVEAGHRSGSLNTAGHAAALGRPLGAVPGPVTSVTSAGCHRLLREYDAVCVTSVDDVVELVLGPVESRQPSLLAPETVRSAEATRLLDALSRRSPRSPTELARLTGLAPRAVAAALGVLALDGAVREEATGWLRS